MGSLKNTHESSWIEHKHLTPKIIVLLCLGEVFALALHPTVTIIPILVGLKINITLIYLMVMCFANSELIYDFIFWRLMIRKMHLNKNIDADFSRNVWLSRFAKRFFMFFLRKYNKHKHSKLMTFVSMGGIPALFLISILPVLGGRLIAVLFAALTKSWRLLGIVLLGNAIHIIAIIYTWDWIIDVVKKAL